MACEDDMLFDLRYDGCNYAAQTDCGERCVFWGWSRNDIVNCSIFGRVKPAFIALKLFRHHGLVKRKMER